MAAPPVENSTAAAIILDLGLMDAGNILRRDGSPGLWNPQERGYARGAPVLRRTPRQGSLRRPERARRGCRGAPALRPEIRHHGLDRPRVEALWRARAALGAAQRRALAGEAEPRAATAPHAARAESPAADHWRRAGDVERLVRRFQVLTLALTAACSAG